MLQINEKNEGVDLAPPSARGLTGDIHGFVLIQFVPSGLDEDVGAMSRPTSSAFFLAGLYVPYEY